MIYCIWYPSGGFGHFINAILSLHGENFARPSTKKIKFSSSGDSHDVELVAPKYLHNPATYQYAFDPTKNYSVLIDNGITNEDQQFLKVFPGAKVIKLCYSDHSWPVVANTLIHKAMRSNLNNELALDTGAWNVTDNWALREKYFLFLRDHELRHSWGPSKFAHNLEIDNLDYISLKEFFNNIQIKTTNFYNEWTEWNTANRAYFEPVELATEVLDAVEQHQAMDLTAVTDIWTQAIVYYFIWNKYNIEVPHNTYENFFKNSLEIYDWLDKESCL